jgi:hypothetical protein
MTTQQVPPRRGGVHPDHGMYQGGSALDRGYRLVDPDNFGFTHQLRGIKQLASNENALIEARNSASKKFNGQLEIEPSNPTDELDKEQFVTSLSDLIEYYGLQTFYYLLDSGGRMVSLLDEAHGFTVEDVTAEHVSRLNEPVPIMSPLGGVETRASKIARFKCYDVYEKYDFALSRLVVESLLSVEFREKLRVRYSHHPGFRTLPGQIIFMMVLDTCNASVEMDIEGAKISFNALSLSAFPGENVSAFATLALKLIKVMMGDWAMQINTGSTLLTKVVKTESTLFNHRMYTKLEDVLRMEQQYHLKNPKLLMKDPLFVQHGPIGCCGYIQKEYAKLYSLHQWPALARSIPEGNHTPLEGDHTRRPPSEGAVVGRRNGPGSGSGESAGGRASGPAREEWKYLHPSNENQVLVSDGTKFMFCKLCVCDLTQKVGYYTQSHTTSGHIMADWKYLHPFNENQVLEADGKTWKFCKYCVCDITQKVGYYTQSHTTSGHIDGSRPASNLSEVEEEPEEFEEFLDAEADDDDDDDDDNLTYIGAWVAQVDDPDIEEEAKPVGVLSVEQHTYEETNMPCSSDCLSDLEDSDEMEESLNDLNNLSVQEGMHWNVKWKRLPDGKPHKEKARYCFGGDLAQEAQGAAFDEEWGYASASVGGMIMYIITFSRITILGW